MSGLALGPWAHSTEPPGRAGALTPRPGSPIFACVSSPIAIGARSTTAPPGDVRSARLEGPLDDRPLIEAVRDGDLHAYGTLYERHVGAARNLARRLCTNRADVDDVVGDAFTNTLRAIKSGRGPRDDMRSYVLTAVRNTVIKSQTRRDPARAVPTAPEQLDRPAADDPYRCADPIAHAFVQLPDRFRDVLWSTCVEGLGPQDVAARTAMSTGAVTSLTLRARRALVRTYFVSRIEQPEASADCASVRQLFPVLLEGAAATSTLARVDAHVANCPNCEAALDEMRTLAGHMRSSFPWFAAVLAWTRALLARAAAPASNAACTSAGGSTLVAAVVLIVLATGDRPSDTTSGASSATPLAASTAVTADTAAAWAEVESPSPAPSARDVADEARSAPALPTVPSLSPVTVREPATVPTPFDALEPVRELPPLVPVNPVDPVDPTRDATVGTTLEPVAEPIVSPLVDAVEPVLTPIVSIAATGTELVVNDVVIPVADSVATTVATVTEAAATVVTQVIEPVIEPATETVDTTGTVAADAVEGVLSVVEANGTVPAGALVGAVQQPVDPLL